MPLLFFNKVIYFIMKTEFQQSDFSIMSWDFTDSADYTKSLSHNVLWPEDADNPLILNPSLFLPGSA